MKSELSLQKLDVDSLRERGLIVTDAEGNEGLRVSVQCPRPLPPDMSRTQWRDSLRCWCEEIAATLSQHGARILPDTLSISAQTVEAFVPVERIEETIHCEQLNEVRMDVVVSHRVTL